MLELRPSNARGGADHGWLKSFHSFSFADYYDPNFMGFSVLRVINEDFIAGGGGFPTHPHKDMEIISYVVSGSLQHKDTMGNSEVIRPGEVQRMSAGTGVRHSEFNSSASETCHLLQIWILPEKQNAPTGYEQKSFAARLERENFVLVGAHDARDGAITIHQDVNLYVGRYESAGSHHIDFSSRRSGWVQLVNGDLTVNGTPMHKGDGLAIKGEEKLDFKISKNSEFLFFDLP